MRATEASAKGRRDSAFEFRDGQQLGSTIRSSLISRKISCLCAVETMPSVTVTAVKPLDA